MQKKLEKFIVDNNLKFNSTDSSLNSDCTIISGFADFIGVQDTSVIKAAIKEALAQKELSTVVATELERVFKFAYTYNYGNWWKGSEAKKLYKF